MLEKRRKAIRLRKQGKSYNEIVKILTVPKSTLSGWLKNVEIPERIKNEILSKAKKTWAKNITEYNKNKSRAARERWIEMAEHAKKEVKKITKRELWLVGIALYWGEGGKKDNWAIKFCNSDPEMVAVMIRFFREACSVPKEKLKPSIQIHRNINEPTAKKYWSKVSGLPEKCFRKTLFQAPKSSKMKRPANALPYGMFRLAISDVKLVNAMRGWIKGIAEQ
jgi:hypothetical protein